MDAADPPAADAPTAPANEALDPPVGLSPDARTWLEAFNINAEPGGHILPAGFRLAPPWARDECVIARELVRRACECGILRLPEDLPFPVWTWHPEVSVQFPESAWTHGTKWFMVSFSWQGQTRRLQMTSPPVELTQLDPSGTLSGVEAAVVFLQEAVAQANHLIVDLRDEVYAALDWHMERAAAQARQPRWRRFTGRLFPRRPEWRVTGLPGFSAVAFIRKHPYTAEQRRGRTAGPG